jgi:peptide/nickel transport system permease protein
MEHSPPSDDPVGFVRAPVRIGGRGKEFRRMGHILRSNPTSVFGIVVLGLLAAVAIYALFTPIPWNGMPLCLASNDQPVTFHEVGLPLGTVWSVDLGGDTQSSTVTSASTSISFAAGSGPEYPFSVGAVAGYTASPSAGAVNVSGAPVSETIQFVSSPPAGAPAAGAKPADPTFHSILSCQVCTYPAGSPAPGPSCYATPKYYPGMIPPTIGFSPLNAGPLPLGSLSNGNPSLPYFYNLYNGMLRGTDYSLALSVAIIGIAGVIGLVLGAISGYFGGVVDEAIMRLVDILLVIPTFLLILVVLVTVKVSYVTLFGLTSLGTSLLLITLTIALTWWPFYARLVRGQVLVAREQPYVEAARASGATNGRIVTRHIMPNSLSALMVAMSLDVGTIPLVIAGIAFLGFQIFPSQYFPEWGTIAGISSLNVLQQFLTPCELGSCVLPWWQLFFPGLAIFLFSISVNFLSDGLRDAFDPRLRR